MQEIIQQVNQLAMLVGYGVFVAGAGYIAWQANRALARRRKRRLASAPLETVLFNPFGEQEIPLGTESWGAAAAMQSQTNN
ncbi:MAG: hypothetical protein IPJ68_00750 [Candidatus Moraniibacteriota bacterium]|nr:MAG: hypothetical protein IPJ68_00750 [Candidatus Moranbacteria bacterium]